MEKFFQLRKNQTTVRTEIVAGITTFMAMAYILVVNAGMFSALDGVLYNSVYIATAISAVVGTLLIGLMAKLPLAQASGMGLNAFFVFTICMGMKFTYANALVMVLVDGIVFVLLTVTGLRRVIFEAIPKAVKMAISAGIGLFIAFLGMQNVNLIVGDPSTKVGLHSFNIAFGSTTWAEIMPILVTIFAIVGIAVLSKKKVKGAVFWGIIGGAVLYYLLGFVSVGEFYETSVKSNLSLDIIQPFRDFFDHSFFKVFTEGFDFSGYIDANGMGDFIVTFITSMLAFCMEKAMLADAIATCFGAVCGTSTVTTFVESSAGVAEGGRTGLTSVACAAMFFIAMFLAPVAKLIPTCATAAALVYVGILMIGGVKDIDWVDPASAVPAFLTMTMMPFSYNISYGIAFGLISYILIKLFSGKVKEIKLGTWIIGLLFTAMFFLSH